MKRTTVGVIAAAILIVVLGGIYWRMGERKNHRAGETDGPLIPVFMYHHFQKEVPEEFSGTIVTPEEFEEHLKVLKENGYNSISFEEYYKYAVEGGPIPEKPFILTIDDGYESNYEEAFPLLKKYNIKATISVVTSTVGKTPGKFPHFTWEQAREMEKSGLVEIQNHTSDHKICTDMSKEELIKNVTGAQKEIEENLGKRKIKVFAYPEGKYTEEIKKVVKDLGFDIQLTVKDGLINRETPLNDIKRINIKHGLKGTDIIGIIEKLDTIKNK